MSVHARLNPGMPVTVTVEGCPCGAAHRLGAGIWERYARLAGRVPPAVKVQAPGGTFLVPRIFVACHGLKAAELPELAGRYGFERAS